jgi:hypothetical protein
LITFIPLTIRRKDPLNFCNDFLANEKDDYLWQAVAEQMRREMR